MWSAPRPLICNVSVNTFQQQRLCFLRGRCGDYITTVTDITIFSFQVTVTNWRVQEGSAVESTRTRMERVLSEV
jgi:hypothetical protein